MLLRSHEKLNCDVLIIGGGGAGLRAAIAAKVKHVDVLLVSKTKIGTTSNTYISKAVIASTGWGTTEDDEDTYISDTIAGGRFLNDQSLVEKMAERSHNEVSFLQNCGVRFDMHEGKPRVIKIPGHKYSRHVYGKNWRGSDLVLPLKRRAKQMGVRFAEQVFVTRIFANDNCINGATGITHDGRFLSIHAKVIVLATGGYAQIYLNTNNAPGITGDGQALAYDLGLPLKDMEFVQFYPTAAGRHGRRLILYERILAQLGVLVRNRQGENIFKVHGINDATTLTRDRFAQLVYQEITKEDYQDQGVFMDMENLSEEAARELSTILPNSWWKGQKVIKVAPTAHFCMGGIAIDQRGETTMKGLFAVGEVAAGVHGANRLGGNALAEVFTMGSWVGELAAQTSANTGAAAVSMDDLEEEVSRLEGTYANKGLDIKELIYNLKQLMWSKVGVIRHKNGLQEALEQLRESIPPVAVTSPKDLIRLLEFQNMRCVAKLVCRAAIKRLESRGSHFRSDYPEEDNQNWVKNIVLKKTKNGPMLEESPVC